MNSLTRLDVILTRLITIDKILLGNIGIALSITCLILGMKNHLFFELVEVGLILNIPITCIFFYGKLIKLLNNNFFNISFKAILIIIGLLVWPLANSSTDNIIFSAIGVEGANLPYSFSFASAIEFTKQWIMVSATTIFIVGYILHYIYMFKAKKFETFKQGAFDFFDFFINIKNIPNRMKKPWYAFNLVFGCMGMCCLLLDFTNVIDNNLNANIISSTIVALDFNKNLYCKNIDNNSKIKLLEVGVHKGNILEAQYNKEKHTYIFSFKNKCVL
jgi:hypothetical protein